MNADVLLGYGALAVLLCTSTIFSSVTKQLTTSLSPVTLLLLSEIVLFGFVLMSYGSLPLIKQLKNLNETEVIWLFWIAVFYGVLAPLMWFTGISLTTATNAELMSKFQLIFTFMAGALYLKERLTFTHMMAAISTLVGLVIISTGGFGGGVELNTGDICVILSGFGYGMGTILTKRFVSHLHVNLIIFVRSAITLTLFVAAEIMMPTSLINEIKAFPMDLLPMLIVFAVVCRLFGMSSKFVCVERLPVTLVSLVTPLTTVTAVMFAAYYLGEQPTAGDYVGGAFIVAGSLLASYVQMRKSKRHAQRHIKLHTNHHLKLF